MVGLLRLAKLLTVFGKKLKKNGTQLVQWLDLMLTGSLRHFSFLPQ